MNGTCSGKSHGSSIRLRSGELGGRVDTLSSRQVARAVSDSLCGVAAFMFLLGKPVPSGSAVAWRGCTWFVTVFGWVKWSIGIHMNARTHGSKAEHCICNEKINVIHFSCQWFQCCGRSACMSALCSTHLPEIQMSHFVPNNQHC